MAGMRGLRVRPAEVNSGVLVSGHTRWENVDPLPNRQALEVQMAYVDGYILALEDLLRDIASLRKTALEEMPSHLSVVVHKDAYETGAILVHKEVRRIAGNTLHQARATLKILEEKHHGEEPDRSDWGENESVLRLTI